MAWTKSVRGGIIVALKSPAADPVKKYNNPYVHRMFNADVLGLSVVDAEVYGLDKQALARSEQATLPWNLEQFPMETHVEFLDGTPSLIDFAVVWDRTDPEVVLGYVATRSRFLPTLKSAAGFHLLDAATLHLPEPPSGRQSLVELKDSFRFELRPNPMAGAMRDVVSNAVVRLGVLVGGFLLIMLPLLLHMLGQPLRRITQHIDRLKQSPGGLMLDRVSAGLPVAEMETIRDSLNGYQARLIDVHSNLDQKNRELWEMAHHDALTGAGNRRAFDKYWHDIQGLLVEQRFSVCFILFDLNHFGVREPVKLSIGIACSLPGQQDSLSSLQWQADVAMYQAKRPGSADIVCFEEGMAEATKGVFSNWINIAVYEAITDGTGLTMFYQPFVPLVSSGSSPGGYFEALVRIRQNGEWIMPCNIFQVVDARRLDVELDRAVLSKVLEDLRGRRIR